MSYSVCMDAFLACLPNIFVKCLTIIVKYLILTLFTYFYVLPNPKFYQNYLYVSLTIVLDLFNTFCSAFMTKSYLYHWLYGLIMLFLLFNGNFGISLLKTGKSNRKPEIFRFILIVVLLYSSAPGWIFSDSK